MHHVKGLIYWITGGALIRCV